MNERWIGDDVVPGALVALRERIESMWTPLQDGFGARVAILIPEVRSRPREDELLELFEALITWFVAPDDVIDRLRAMRAPAWSARADLPAYQRLADALDWAFRDILAEAYTLEHSRAYGNSTRLMLALVQRLQEVEAHNGAAQEGDGSSGRGWNHRVRSDGTPPAPQRRAYMRPRVERLELHGGLDGIDPRSPINEVSDL